MGDTTKDSPGGVLSSFPALASALVQSASAEQITSNHDVHATLLHLLGMDHKKLTYYFNGRNMRLTDVHGELIPQIVGNTKRETVTG